MCIYIILDRYGLSMPRTPWHQTYPIVSAHSVQFPSVPIRTRALSDRYGKAKAKGKAGAKPTAKAKAKGKAGAKPTAKAKAKAKGKAEAKAGVQ